MNINKCEFFKIKIIFLNVILFTKDLRMNSNKIRDIVEWAQLICLKNVQTFVKFCNFYRRFIKEFFKLTKFLTRMIRKKIDFEWFDEINQVFETLKKQMIETFIFKHYDRKRKIILECDSSNWCLKKILFQYDDEKILHSMIFYSKKMILAKCNYEIYDKKLLIIIRCLKH